MKKNTVVGVFIVIAIIVSFYGFLLHGNAGIKPGDDLLLNKYGLFSIDNGEKILKIKRDKRFMVDYTVISKNGEEIIRMNQKYAFHCFEGWSFYWEKKRSYLWVQSGDIGSWVWVSNDKKEYEYIHVSLKNKDEIKCVPRCVYNTKPGYYKNIFNYNEILE